jgi:transcriptional regulator with GAF, ATPase, and Fis domain
VTEPRETQVLAAVVTLVDSLLRDFDVVELLTELTEHCAQLLDVSSAGLLLADPHGHLHLMAATSEKTQDLELFQLQADEGPCLDCFATGEGTSVADIRSATRRWPRFVPAAVESGFASVHAVPMRAAGSALGVLGLFGNRVGALSDADLLVAQTLAHVASVAIVQEHSPTPSSVLPHLRNALVSKVLVEQAKGYLSESLGVSVEDAFALLRRYARSHGGHLSEDARRLISESGSRAEIVAGIRSMANPTW